MGASDFSKLPHIGESLKRKEDYRFLTGAGQYTDDIVLPNMHHAVFVRSPHAHAHIRKIDKAAALKSPGVIVHTGTLARLRVGTVAGGPPAEAVDAFVAAGRQGGIDIQRHHAVALCQQDGNRQPDIADPGNCDLHGAPPYCAWVTTYFI